jgi:uncharacterized protein YukJ
MALRRYGVLKGNPIRRRLANDHEQHYHLLVEADGTSYRASINVQSRLYPSELEYAVVDPLDHPITDRLSTLAIGFTPLSHEPDGLALDYVRGELVDRGAFTPLAYSVPGPANDLNEAIDAYVSAAIADRDALVYAFGTRWGPEWRARDHVFGFRPRNGVHDIHMNQGNVRPFTAQNGVWQDGALLLAFPDRVVGIFLKFQSQAWHTDDRSGQRGGTASAAPAPRDRRPRAAYRGVAPRSRRRW